MKLTIRIALVAVTATTACQPPPRSETLPSLEPDDRRGAPATTASGTAEARPEPAPSPAELAALPPAERTAALEARVARLEADAARNLQALEFLRKVFEQQKAQDREQLAADGMYAVEIADSVKAGQTDGPASAPVTIVKAFDFACPYCFQAAATMDELIQDYRGKCEIRGIAITETAAS
jgi:protein-disulfide isomerase